MEGRELGATVSPDATCGAVAGATCILYYTVRPSRPAYGTLFAVIEKEVQFHETEQVPAHNTLALRSSWLRWQRRGAALAHPRTVPQARGA